MPDSRHSASGVHVPASAADLNGAAMIALMLAVFTVAIGFGVTLPLLPDFIVQSLGESASSAQVSRHTGMLGGVYSLALFAFAPWWGRYSDRTSRSRVLFLALLAFAATMLAFGGARGLALLYAERLFSGVFGAAITPVATAAIGDAGATAQVRARRVALLSMAGLTGFLVGPPFGVAAMRLGSELSWIAAGSPALLLPLRSTALLALVSAAVVWAWVPRTVAQPRRRDRAQRTADVSSVLVKLLVLTFLVSAGVGMFEIGLALRATQDLRLSPYELAWMFTECSLVMFVAQSLAFSPWFRAEATRWLIAPAAAIFALALLAVPFATTFAAMVAATAAAAASAGVLSPTLTYWSSTHAAGAQGYVLGRQTAASSLGVTIGSVVGGVSAGVVLGGPFTVAAATVALAAIVGLPLARDLMSVATRAAQPS